MKKNRILQLSNRWVVDFYDALGGPIAEKARLAWTAGDWVSLANLKVDPSSYTDPLTYLRDSACADLLRKCEGLPVSRKRLREEAVKTFWESELRCYGTNVRIRNLTEATPADWAHAQLYDKPQYASLDLLRKVKNRVRSIIGNGPPYYINGRHGPGATYADRGHDVTVLQKMSSSPTLTPGCWPFLLEWHTTAWKRSVGEIGPTFVPGNRFTTVPKTAKTDRGICIEPSLNVFYQLGVGENLRSKLMGVGIDLTNGQDTHRRVACEASKTGQYATVDLSSASDTVSKELVKALFPAPWYDLLSTLRSPVTEIDGKLVHLEKFSSMGNGYTFELETVIFLSICLAVGDMWRERNPDFLEVTPGENLWVYGDDIIVPTVLVEDVLSALRLLGFVPNQDKTFLEGSFRESCGGDFFEGHPVRGYYLKEFPNEPQQYIALANGIRRLGLDYANISGGNNPLTSVWFRILDAIPTYIRKIRGPEWLGDLVIHDEERFHSKYQRGEVTYNYVYRPCRFRVIGYDRFKTDTVMAAALYGTEGHFGRNGVVPRGRSNILGYKKGLVTTIPSGSWLPVN